jgi:hypothetical protein
LYHIWNANAIISKSTYAGFDGKKKRPPERVAFSFLAEDEGFDMIMERLGLALAGGAHPRRI